MVVQIYNYHGVHLKQNKYFFLSCSHLIHTCIFIHVVLSVAGRTVFVGFDPCILHVSLFVSFFKMSIPTHEIIAPFVGPFVYFHTSCVRTAKALVRLRGCTVSPEPSLFAYAISTTISCICLLLSHRTTKPAKTQIGLGGCWELYEQMRIQISFRRTAKTLIRLSRCPGWSESLGAHVILLVLSCFGSNWDYYIRLINFISEYVYFETSISYSLYCVNLKNCLILLYMDTLKWILFMY